MKDTKTKNLLDTLMKCITACENCATKCLSEENVNQMEKCIRTDRDCADICRITATFVARESQYMQKMLKQCIELCKDCEKECRKHDHDHCQKCADACRECVQACEEYMNVPSPSSN